MEKLNALEVGGRLCELFTELSDMTRRLAIPYPLIEKLNEIEKELSARAVVYCDECECVVFPFIAEVCEREEDEE